VRPGAGGGFALCSFTQIVFQNLVGETVQEHGREAIDLMDPPSEHAPLMCPSLSIVLPVYNEEENVVRAVRAAAASAAALLPDWEIVAVDDGSNDGSRDALARLEQEFRPRLRLVVHSSNRGYGAALRSGFQAARGDLVFYTDSDNQFDLTELADFLPLMTAVEVAVGYRVDRKDSTLRRVSSAVFNRLAAFVFELRLRDINCSFKLFRREVLQQLTLESDGFFIDTEIMARLRLAGRHLVERGVRHLPRSAGRSKVRPGDVVRTLVAIARMRWRIRASGRAAAATRADGW
jgi:glycosyltransferase involved in cell wall biosynthesis